jgi:hypothetical protein
VRAEDAGTTPAHAASGTAFLRVVRGEPTDEELAALVAVLTARVRAGARTDARAAAPRRRWREGVPMLRSALHPGRGAWRASAGPRQGFPSPPSLH